MLNNRELLKLSNDNLRAHLDTQDKVRTRVQGGISQKTDLQQAQGRVALAKSIVSARAGICGWRKSTTRPWSAGRREISPISS